jgi:hypothetical protein
MAGSRRRRSPPRRCRRPPVAEDEHLRAGTFVPVDDDDFGTAPCRRRGAAERHAGGWTPGAGAGRRQRRCTATCWARPRRLAGCGRIRDLGHGTPGPAAELTRPPAARDVREGGGPAPTWSSRPGGRLAPLAKRARAIAVAALTGLDWGAPCGPCVNGLRRRGATATSSRWSAAPGRRSTLIVPKTRSARDVWRSTCCTRLETKLGLGGGSAWRCWSRSRRAGQRGGDREGERRLRPSSSAPGTSRLAGPGWTATSTRPATTPATSGTSPASVVAPGRGIDAIDALSRTRTPGLPAQRHPGQPAGLRRQVGHPPRPDRHRARGLLPTEEVAEAKQAMRPTAGRGRRAGHRRPAGCRRGPHAPGREHLYKASLG